MVHYKSKLPGHSTGKLSPVSRLAHVPAAEYSSDAAKLLASISAWSYSSIDDFKDVLANNEQMFLTQADFLEISVRNPALFIVATSQVVRTSDKKVAIVCFRGTEPTNVINWITDLTTKKVRFGDGANAMTIHEGFVRNFEAVWKGQTGILAHLLNPAMLNESYDESRSNGKTELDELEAIYITGHSLGGSMALLACMDLAQKKHDPVYSKLWSKVRGVYTYGQPMVVCQSCAGRAEELVGHLLFRHVYYNDVIPHCPSVTMGLYAHIGKEYRYHPLTGWQKKKAGEDTVTQLIFLSVSAPFAFAGAFRWTFPTLGLVKSPWSILDHSPLQYFNALYEEGTKGGIRSLPNGEDHVSLVASPLA